MTAAWAQLEAQGFKVRTRALTTTLFARLFLADLFIHGIGGAKYDELSDELIRRFYGYEPPSFLTLSATLWLPIEHQSAGKLVERRHQLVRQCRDLHWNPQRHLEEFHVRDPALQKLSQEKQTWIVLQTDTPTQRCTRFDVLRRLTQDLRRAIEPEEKLAEAHLHTLDEQLAEAAILERRDYSFVLYPATVLRPFVTQFLTMPRAASFGAPSAD
jgi:hypothetical protein